MRRPRHRDRLAGRAVLVAAAAALLVGGGLLGALGVAGVGGPAAGAAALAAQRDTCPDPGERPPPGADGPLFTDSGVAVYAGGDYRADGNAAESEGVLVVGGEASFERTAGGIYNVGTVGVGSGIDPAPRSDMLHVGGSVRVGAGTTVSVGAAVRGSPGGGNVRVGAGVTGSVDTNGGTLTTDLGDAALAGFETVPKLINATSQSLAGMPVTGGVTRVITPRGFRLTFVGDDASPLQVFRVTATQLNAASEFAFTKIPDDAHIAVTVTDDAGVTVTPNFFSINGVRVDDFAAPNNGFGRAASALLWNFPATTDLTLRGSSQFMGSILLPRPDSTFDVTASTNGRIYVGGNIHTHGEGNEHHNYPWDSPFGCLDGSFAVSKSVSGDAADDVPADTSFTVRYTTSGASGEAQVRADGATVDGPQLPAGTVVTFTEVVPDVPGVDWRQPTIIVDGRATNQLTVGQGTARVVIDNIADPSTTSPPTKPPTSPPTKPPTSPPPTTSTHPPATGSSSTGTSAVPTAIATEATLSAGALPIAVGGGPAATGAPVETGLTVAAGLLVSGTVLMVVGARRTRRH